MFEETPKQIKFIAAYGRVSTSNQENEGTIETQLSAVRDFALKSGYTIVKEYLDNGWSGDTLARPELDKLREDARKKMWEAVLIYDPDRLARRYSYQELVMDELKEAGISVLFVTVPEAKNDGDKIMYGMRGLFAQYERMKIAERFRLGKVRKARENHIITTEAPYGYTFILKKGKRGDSDFHQGYYVINEQEAEVVKKLFSWVANDALTLRGIVRRLQELDIKPRKSKRGVWNTSTLSTLLRNKTFIGEAHYGASYAVVPINPLKTGGYKKNKKTSRRIKPETEWIKIDCPKLIDKELFERVQQQLKSNFDLSWKNKKNDYLLAGKLWCTCGCRRTGEGPMHGKHLYYRCTDRVKSFPLPPNCKEGKSLNARVADELVWDKISQLMCSPELLAKQVERWFETRSSKAQQPAIDIESTQKNISKLKDQEDRYTKAYGGGVISVEQLKEYVTPLRDKISILQNQIEKAKIENIKTGELELPKQQEIEHFTKKATESLIDLNFMEKQAIVRNVVDKIVGNQKELQIYGYIPLTSNVEYCTTNRNCGATKCWEINSF